MKKLFWLSWPQPTADFRPLTDPPDARVMGWWCSGQDAEDRALLCALVEGRTMQEAKLGVRASWPEAPSVRCSWRIEQEREDDWTPGDRFPLSTWMRRRLRERMEAA